MVEGIQFEVYLSVDESTEGSEDPPTWMWTGAKPVKKQFGGYFSKNVEDSGNANLVSIFQLANVEPPVPRGQCRKFLLSLTPVEEPEPGNELWGLWEFMENRWFNCADGSEKLFKSKKLVEAYVKDRELVGFVPKLYGIIKDQEEPLFKDCKLENVVPKFSEPTIVQDDFDGRWHVEKVTVIPNSGKKPIKYYLDYDYIWKLTYNGTFDSEYGAQRHLELYKKHTGKYHAKNS